MRFLFIHQNMPGQYRHFVERLARDPANRIVFVTRRPDSSLPANVARVTYTPAREPATSTHHYLRGLERHVLHAQAVYRACAQLKANGFTPDVVLGHNGWGEFWFVKDVWPDAPVIGYFEFFYRLHGSDMGFDPEFPLSADDGPRITLKNAGNLIGLQVCDRGQTPTLWQRRQYPDWAQGKLTVLFDGLDTARLVRRPDAAVPVPGRAAPLTAADNVVTFGARTLEPYRGVHVFLRAVPEILRRRPDCHVVIAGSDEVHYGVRLPPGETYRGRLLKELAGRLDSDRVHFVGLLPREGFHDLLSISSAHVYLTYPFVLSWSMLEAMALGCLVIGSRTGPVEEVIEDRVNGLLVDFHDRAGLVDRIEEALDRSDEIGNLQLRARESVVARFDLERACWPGFLSLIDSTVHRRA